MFGEKNITYYSVRPDSSFIKENLPNSVYYPIALIFLLDETVKTT